MASDMGKGRQEMGLKANQKQIYLPDFMASHPLYDFSSVKTFRNEVREGNNDAYFLFNGRG
jgi:hypothetical protein